MRTLERSEVVSERELSRAEPALPAHELLRLQQTAGNAAVSRLLARCPDCGGTCEDAEKEEPPHERILAVHRAPDTGTPDCPGYDPGEHARSRSAAGVLPQDVLPRGPAFLVADFGIDQSTVKATARNDADLQAWFSEFETDSTYRISILGLDDCVGDRAKREQLRKQRSEAVRAMLGPEAQKRVLVADAAPVDEYTAENVSAEGRAMNRGALIVFQREIDGDAIDVTARPEPKAPERDTSDCSQEQTDALSKSHRIAIRMVEKAMGSIPGADSTDPVVLALLRKYFRDDGVSTHMHVRSGFQRIMRGLNDDFTYECEDDCDSGDLAYVVPVLGWRVHVCSAAFGDDYELAATIIHECAHKYDFSFGDEYCEGGCSPSMDRWDAYSNADSYSEFAQELYTKF